MTNRTLFKPSTETLLTRGLNSMTMACDALQGQVESLTTESTALKAEVVRLQSQLLLNGIENE